MVKTTATNQTNRVFGYPSFYCGFKLILGKIKTGVVRGRMANSPPRPAKIKQPYPAEKFAAA
jgi:hypothetical protein